MSLKQKIDEFQDKVLSLKLSKQKVAPLSFQSDLNIG